MRYVSLLPVSLPPGCRYWEPSHLCSSEEMRWPAAGDETGIWVVPACVLPSVLDVSIPPRRVSPNSKGKLKSPELALPYHYNCNLEGWCLEKKDRGKDRRSMVAAVPKEWLYTLRDNLFSLQMDKNFTPLFLNVWQHVLKQMSFRFFVLHLAHNRPTPVSFHQAQRPQKFEEHWMCEKKLGFRYQYPQYIYLALSSVFC